MIRILAIGAVLSFAVRSESHAADVAPPAVQRDDAA